METDTRLLDWVHYYHDLHFPIFALWGIRPDNSCFCPDGPRCATPGKHPRESEEEWRANVSSGTDDDKWEAWEKECNIGVPCGSDSGIIGIHVSRETLAGAFSSRDRLDSDTKPGAGGRSEQDDSWQWLMSTMTVVTGTGDQIALYRIGAAGELIIRSSDEDIPGIGKVLGEDKWVVLPPSRHSSGGYWRYLFPPPPASSRAIAVRSLPDFHLTRLADAKLVDWTRVRTVKDVDWIGSRAWGAMDGGVRRSLTITGFQRRFVDRWQGEVWYVTGLGWLVFDQRHNRWRHDAEGTTVRGMLQDLTGWIIKDEVESIIVPPLAAGRAIVDRANAQRDALRAFGNRMKNASIDAISRSLPADERAVSDVKSWDGVRQRSVLAVADGSTVVDLRHGKVSDYSTQAWRITMSSAVPWVQGAWKGWGCGSEFEQALLAWCSEDVELAQWLQRWMGYCLTGEMTEQRMLILVGPPGTGKSTFVSLGETLLGGWSCGLRVEMVAARSGSVNTPDYERAELRGKRFVVAAEPEEGSALQEKELKPLIVGDTLTGRMVRQRPFSFSSTAKIVLATNHMPRVRDAGLWRRLWIVRFEKSWASGDYDAEDRKWDLLRRVKNPRDPLVIEALDWAIEGARLYYEGGVGSCRRVRDWYEEVREAEDSTDLGGLMMALYQCFGTTVPSVEHAFQVYLEWAGRRMRPLVTKADFAREFRNRDDVLVESNGKIRLLNVHVVS